MKRHRIFPLAATVLMGLLGCQEPPTPFQGKYNDQGFNYFLVFNNNKVEITTPEGSMLKEFELLNGKIEVLYWDAIGKDTKLYFIENNLKTQLHCTECAKYRLPTNWNIDPLWDSKKVQ